MLGSSSEKNANHDDNSNEPLKAAYRQIANTAANHTPNWPASTNFVQMLDHCYDNDDPLLALNGEDGDHCANSAGICTTKYRARRFKEHGPFGLVALITHESNPHAVPLIDSCLDCFDAFVQDLRSIVDNNNLANTPAAATSSSSSIQQQASPLLHIIPRAKVPHACVFLVHEHPSLLSPSERDAWQPVDDPTMDTLIRDDLSPILESQLSTSTNNSSNTTSPQLLLQVEAILLTPDGAMIAGFVDVTTPPASRYSRIKMDCLQAVQERLGTVTTSRPKNLIHVTLGRVLGFGNPLLGEGGGGQEHSPTDEDPDISNENTATPVLSRAQQQLVCQLVQRYNQEILPQRLQEIRARHAGGIWRLQHVSMLRNTVWFCDENIIYKTWHFPNMDQPSSN